MRINRVKQFEDIYFKTYACKQALDKYPQVFVDEVYQNGVNHYCSYLKEKINNPIVTALITKRVLEEHPVKDLKNYSTNLKAVEQSPKTKDLLAELAAININYPETQFIREDLISEGRIDLFEVTPKLRGLKKLMFKFKILF